jgi:alanyl aminopeptidase
MQPAAIRGSLGRMRTWPVATLVSLMLAAACSAGAPAGARPGLRPGGPDGARGPAGAARPARDGQPPAAPGFHLGDDVTPIAYTLDLDIDPRLAHYQGQVAIDVRIAQPTRRLWLHAADLDIEAAHLERRDPRPRAGDGASAPGLVAASVHAGPGAGAATLPGPDPAPSSEVVRLELAHAVPPGLARIVLRFRGRHGERVGIFRQETGGDAYVFSDFEPVDARRAFPCFDEPRFKTPWRVSLTVPAGMQALSNMPAERAESLPRGKTRVHFAPTRPLPTYLVAVAVGPFEIVDGPAGPPPLRVVVPRGMAAWAQEVLATAPPLLGVVQGYLGTDVPFPKLDLVAVPEFSGAMENPGLITVAMHILLADPDGSSITQQRLMALVAAHEFAHLWLGDLVTPASWRDLWLNEGFATWLADKALAGWRPERRPELDQVVAREQAMLQDQGALTRAVRAPVAGRQALAAVFDDITYKKGGALVAMIEAWMGEDAFRQALRAYLAAHADRSATTEGLLAALAAVARREVRAPLQSFLALPGVPLVHAELACAQAGGAVDVTVRLAQRRYWPLGAGDNAEPAPPWHVPVCMRYDDGAGGAAESCALVDAPELRVPLDVDRCPAWLVPNAHAHGYYRYAMPAPALAALARAPLSGREALDLAHGVRALLRSGDLAADQGLGLASALAARPERHVVEAVIDLLVEVERDLLAPEHQERFRGHARALFADRARGLGLAPAPGEGEESTLLRPRLVAFAGRWGRDPALLRDARQHAEAWLRTGRGIAPGMIEATLTVAAAGGDEALFRAMERALRNAGAGDETRQLVLAAALAAFDGPALLERAVALVGDASLPTLARHRLVTSLAERRDGLPLVLAYLAAHQEELGKSRDGLILLLTPLLGAPLCSDGDFDRAYELGRALVDRGAVNGAFVAENRAAVASAARTCARVRAAQAGRAGAFYR